MATIATRPLQMRPRAVRRFRDGWHALLVCALLVAFAIAAITIGIKSLDPIDRQALSQEDLRTGALLFVPNFGNKCRQSEFDNVTGRFTDKGPVPCDVAIAKSVGANSNWSPARLEAVRNGFRKN